MTIPILVETRKAVLEAEIKALDEAYNERVNETISWERGYLLGLNHALRWVLNGGMSPTEMVGLQEVKHV